MISPRFHKLSRLRWRRVSECHCVSGWHWVSGWQWRLARQCEGPTQTPPPGPNTTARVAPLGTLGLATLVLFAALLSPAILWGEESAGSAEAFRWEKTPEQLTLFRGDRPVFNYQLAFLPSPNPDQPWFGRSGFIHPIWDPEGHVLTDDFPPDHMHQHALMFPWTKTIFEGRRIDFWNSALKQGKVEHRKLISHSAEPSKAYLEVELAHVDITDPEDPKDVLIERWKVTAYEHDEVFLFDLESIQETAGDSPLEILQYHYGGMGIRGARAWVPKGEGDFLTSEGKTRANGNHTRPRWVDVYGNLDGEVSGITVMCHPGNYNFPQPVRLHPDKPYFSFTPQVVGSFRIVPGEPYRSRYRFVAHRGMIDKPLIEGLWQPFAATPLEEPE